MLRIRFIDSNHTIKVYNYSKHGTCTSLALFLKAHHKLSWILDCQQSSSFDIGYVLVGFEVIAAAQTYGNTIVNVICNHHPELKPSMPLLLLKLEEKFLNEKFTRCFMITKTFGELVLESYGYKPLLRFSQGQRTLMLKSWDKSIYGPVACKGYNSNLITSSGAIIHLETLTSAVDVRDEWVDTLNARRGTNEFLHLFALRGALDLESLKQALLTLSQQTKKLSYYMIHITDATLSPKLSLVSKYIPTKHEGIDCDWDNIRAIVDVNQLTKDVFEPMGIDKIYGLYKDTTSLRSSYNHQLSQYFELNSFQYHQI